MADVGPVDYLVLAFPGDRFRGESVAELKKLVDGGIVRILDLAFIRRGEDGAVRFLELDSADPVEKAAFADIEGEVGGLISEEDLSLLADEVPVGSAAAVVVWENVWAAPIATAIQRAGGSVVAFERVPSAVVNRDLEAIGSG